MYCKKLYKSTAKALQALLIAVASVGISSCADEALWEDRAPDGNGFFEPFDLTISFDAESSDSKTRGSFDTDVTLNSAWVAMFDIATGNLVAMAESENELGEWPGTHPNKPESDAYSVTLRSLMINDHNNTVCIAGVANYDGIDVKNANGDDMSLIEALREVRNISDYKNIAVNTASAERAIANSNCPLMAGFWGESHGNFTVDLDNRVQTNNSSVSTIEMFDMDTKMIREEHVKHIQEDGMIHLRRLYSHINVDVAVNSSNFKTFKDVSVEVMNAPSYTFLQEHTTLTTAGAYDSNDEWMDDTHTAADKYGVLKTTGIIKENGTYSNTDDAAFVMYDEDKLAVTSSNDVASRINFGFWHYESKHWGLKGVTSQNDREKRFTGNNEIFSSLCPSESLDFNNSAPYFIIRAYVETNDDYAGNAEFYIHEGFCCLANGDQAGSEADAVRDFSTFRNCRYNYNIEINGISSIIQKVSKDDFSGEYYSGVGGEIWGTRTTDIEVNNTETKEYDLEVPTGELYWCIRDRNQGVTFGKAMSDAFELKDKYTAYPANVDEGYEYQNNAFYNAISVNGAPLDQYLATRAVSDLGVPVKVTFSPQSATDGYLYLCGISRSDDGTTKMYTVYCFNQDGTRLDAPVLTMPNAPAGNNLIIGINDHTVRWKEVAGADSYTISLNETGYSVTLKPGESTVDGDYTGTLTAVGNGELEFRIRYARSKNGMLALVNEDTNINEKVGTISVVASNSSTGSKSNPGTISKNFINPYWDFNSTAWQNGVKTLTLDPAGNNGIVDGLAANQNLTVNGLTLYTGNSNKMTYEQHSVYTFRPNGSGNTTARGFAFKAFSKGKINVWTSANSATAGTGRYIVTAQPNASGTLVSTTLDSFNANGSKSGTQSKSPNISLSAENQTAPYNMYIFNSGDILYYRIIFTPQD